MVEMYTSKWSVNFSWCVTCGRESMAFKDW